MMIELILLIVSCVLSISGIWILKKFSDNEHAKDYVRMQRHGNKMSVSCLLMIWLIVIYQVMATPHHLSVLYGYVSIADLHEYRTVHRTIAYAMVGVGLKIINQIIEYQKQRRKTD